MPRPQPPQVEVGYLRLVLVVVTFNFAGSALLLRDVLAFRPAA
jgi:hypothetical protein